jgi:hypothetical protein
LLKDSSIVKNQWSRGRRPGERWFGAWGKWFFGAPPIFFYITFACQVGPKTLVDDVMK